MQLLHHLIRDFWLVLAIIAILLQICFIHSVRFIVLAFAAGLIHILITAGDLNRTDYLLQGGIFLGVTLLGYIFIVPAFKRYFGRRDIIDHNPIGDFAHVYEEDLRKNSLGKIMWHGQVRQAYIDEKEDCDLLQEGASVIIIDHKDKIFYVKPDDMSAKILASNNEKAENENM